MRDAHGRASSARHLGAAALGLLLAVVPAAAGAVEDGTTAPAPAPPLPWRDPSPPARMFLQLPFEGPGVVPAGSLRGEAQLAYANAILVASSPALSLDVDLESASLLGRLRYGVGRGWEAQLGIPLTIDWGGFMDGPIEAVERAVGATSMPGRRSRPPGQARFRLTRPDGSGVTREGAGAGVGDVWAGLKGRVLEGAGGVPALSLRGIVKAPTGRPPFGSGEVDLGASLSAAWTPGRLALALQLDVVAPTAGLRDVGLETRPYGAAQLGVAFAVARGLSVHGQWSSHLPPLARTGLAPLDRVTHYVVAGASVALSRSVLLDAGFAENVLSPAWGADFTVLLGIRSGRGDSGRRRRRRGTSSTPSRS